MPSGKHRRRAALALVALGTATCGVEAGVRTMGATPSPDETAPVVETAPDPSDPAPDVTSSPTSRPPNDTTTASSVDAIDDTTADTTVAPVVCAVTELLVPTCGAWFGVSSPSADGRYDYTQGFAEFAALVDEPPDILRFYQRDGEPFPDDEHRRLAERDGAPRSILHFSWKPAFGHTWREIADGRFDAEIDTVARSLMAYPHKMFLTIHHEPENDVDQNDGSGMTPADYVDMYRHVVGKLRAHGVDNVVYVMNFMGFEGWADIVDDLYPGDDVVDWIAWDPYALEDHSTVEEMINDRSGVWPGFYVWARAKAPGKPLMLAEWGFDLPTQPWAAEAVVRLPDVLRTDFPEIKAAVYWNDRSERFDAQFTRDGDNRRAFAAAYASIADDPYFDQVATDFAP